MIGVVQRGGKVVAEVAERLTGRRILAFIKRAVKIQDSELMTDEYPAYQAIGREMKHHIVNHQEYIDGAVHTNTIEGFWSLLKRSWDGSHHHYTVGHLTPYYVAERCYTYNYRGIGCLWTKLLTKRSLCRSVNTEDCVSRKYRVNLSQNDFLR